MMRKPYLLNAPYKHKKSFTCSVVLLDATKKTFKHTNFVLYHNLVAGFIMKQNLMHSVKVYFDGRMG